MKMFFLSFWKFVKNKYIAATLVFLLFFCFLGENNIIVSRQLQREVRSLRREVELLREDLARDSAAADGLAGDGDALEAYGREHYYMKKADEDIFIVK